MKILLCAPVNEKEEIFVEYLESLRRLAIPDNFFVDKLFFLHNSERLIKYLNKDFKENYCTYNNDNKYVKDELTHRWQDDNFSDVANMKNALLQFAIVNNYDYIFFVDSDLILHHKTLVNLVEQDKDIIANIFWTKWQNNMIPMPNCWNYDHYSIVKAELSKWKTKGTYQVGMTGACTLIKRKVFDNKYINWNPIYNLPVTKWEDRAFCSRVAMCGHDIWIDTHYPAIHLYRMSEYKKYIKGELNHE